MEEMEHRFYLQLAENKRLQMQVSQSKKEYTNLQEKVHLLEDRIHVLEKEIGQ